MFETYESYQPNENNPEPPASFSKRGRFYALAIDPRSEHDSALIDGRECAVGAPLLFDGTERSVTIAGLRRATGTLRVLGITNKCGLAALPAHRTRLVKYSEATHAATRQIGPFCITGRRHVTLKMFGVIGNTFDVWVEANNVSRILNKRILNVTLAATREDYEVGGTDHEESWDHMYVQIGVSASQTTALRLEAYGELGR